MSNLHFPALPGKGWNITRTVITSTIVKRTASGQSVRIALYSDPNWQWDIPHNYLRSDPTHSEMQQLVGFVAGRFGQFDSFLYKEPEDCIALGASIGTGTGSLRTFQLQRTLGTPGGSTQRIWEPNSSYQAYNVYFNSALVNPSLYTISAGPNGGLVTFTSAPSAGVAITADFGYDWRVVFTADSADFNNWMYQKWESKSLKFETTRQ